MCRLSASATARHQIAGARPTSWVCCSSSVSPDSARSPQAASGSVWLTLSGGLLSETRPPDKALRPMRLLLVAPPGAGKGTQAAKLAEHYGITNLSSGELLRREIAADSEIG